MTGKTAKGEATRRAIIATAAGVFASRGYAGTRMEDIFETTGLTKGAVYFHFSSKEALARAVVAEYKQRWLELARDSIDAHEGALEQFRGLAELLIELSSADTSNWSIARLTQELDDLTGNEEASAVSEPMADWVALMRQILELGQAQGVFALDQPSDDVAVLAVAAFDGLKTTSDALGAAGRAAFAGRAQLLVAFLERGILA